MTPPGPGKNEGVFGRKVADPQRLLREDCVAHRLRIGCRIRNDDLQMVGKIDRRQANGSVAGCGQGMTAGAYRNHARKGCDRLAGDMCVRFLCRRQAEVAVAVEHQAQRHRHRRRHKLHPHAGMGAGKIADDPCNIRQRKQRVERHAQRRFHALIEAVRLGPQRVGLYQQGPGFCKQGRSGLRQFGAVLGAVEQRQAQFRFEVQDGAAEAGLGTPERARCRPERTVVDDGDEYAQLVERQGIQHDRPSRSK